METRRIKYRFSPNSSAHRLTLLLALVSAALIGSVYWPVFVKFKNTPKPDSTLERMVWVYGILIASLLLFGLFSAMIGRHSMAFPALFCVPVCIYYAIEKIGVLQYLIFGNEGGIFGVYAKYSDYFSGRNLVWVIAAAAAALIAMFAMLSIVYNGGNSRGFAMFTVVVAAIFRVLFAIYDIRANYQPAFDKGGISSTDYTYAILLQAAAVIFFFTLAVLAIELHRTFDEEQEQPETHEQPTPQPEPVQTRQPEPTPELMPTDEQASDEGEQANP